MVQGITSSKDERHSQGHCFQGKESHECKLHKAIYSQIKGISWIILFVITAATDYHGREEPPCSIFTSTVLDMIHPIQWQSRNAPLGKTWDGAYSGKMLNQNSLQRMSELQLCKGGARMWFNKMFSDMSSKLRPAPTLLSTRRAFSDVMHFRKICQDSTSFS